MATNTTKQPVPLPRIDPPAFRDDFGHDADKSEQLREEWSKRVRRWTEAAIVGDPWTRVRDDNREAYFSLLDTPVAPGAQPAKIGWVAFPNRINVIFPNSSDAEKWHMADNGPPPVNNRPYRPEGPRGWQDEYCEWSVQSKDGKIVRVDFTCENREYWSCLWRVDPDRVVELYRELLPPELAAQVKKEDLYLLRDGRPVIERETGRPAYNPLNEWNSSTSTGAIHLVSRPNTLFAEIELAAAATILREHDGRPVTDEVELIRCSFYGTEGRNSDPHIGAQVNAVVRSSNVRVSLMNPVGLYIQNPDFSRFELPPHAPPGRKPSDYWKLVRGTPGFGLHATFAVPEADGFTVGDITIDGVPIESGAQIAQTFDIALSAASVPSARPPVALACRSDRDPPLPAILDFNYVNLLLVDDYMDSPPATVHVEQGTTVENLGLWLSAGADLDVAVMFSGSGVTPWVKMKLRQPDGTVLLLLSVSVDSSASLGDRSITLRNPQGTEGPPTPGRIEVTAPGALAPASTAQEGWRLRDFVELAARIGARRHHPPHR
ncbi:hypothetical protein WMF30_50475 [Sorangium sp. So ce134]